MKITTKQLKSLIREAIADNNELSPELMAMLDALSPRGIKQVISYVKGIESAEGANEFFGDVVRISATSLPYRLMKSSAGPGAVFFTNSNDEYFMKRGNFVGKWNKQSNRWITDYVAFRNPSHWAWEER